MLKHLCWLCLFYIKHGLNLLLFYNLVNCISKFTSTSTFCSLAEQRQIALDKHNGLCQGSASWGKDVPEKGNSRCESTGFDRKGIYISPDGMFGVVGVWHENEETSGDKVGLLLTQFQFSAFRQLERILSRE